MPYAAKPQDAGA